MKLQCDLFDFAYVPGWYWQLDSLAEMVLPEPWRFKEPVYSTKNLDTPILERYIHSIFKKQAIDFNSEGDPAEAARHFHVENELCCFHTGLYTGRYKAVYACFDRNKKHASMRGWYFRGFVLVFPPEYEEDKYVILPFFWIPEDNMEIRVRRDHVPYDVWEKQGFLKTTEGNVVHYGFIEAFIEELGTRYHIREIAFDRWGATQMVQNLEGLGFTVVPFGQGFKDMSPPTKELMRLTLDQKIAHGGNPVLRWMMDNIHVRTDPAGNVKPDKEKSTEKIDGAVAAVMALDRASRGGGELGASIYDERGLLLL